MSVPQEHEEWEVTELNDILVAYEVAAATERKERDRLIATWRDHIHEFIMATDHPWPMLHKVIDSMDNFLNRAGGRRK